MDTPASQPRPDAARSKNDTWGWFWAVLVVGLIIGLRFTPFRPVQAVFGGWQWLTEQALDIARELFESYGYPTAFLAPMLENTLLLGALIPGVLVMLLAGLSAHDGLIALEIALPLAIAGAIIGDTVSYSIGRFGSQRLGPESKMVQWSERMRGPLMEHGVLLVLVYHFFGYSRLIGPAAAGFLKMPLGRWMLLDYIGVTIWVVVFMLAGYLLGVFGLSLDDTDRNIRVFEILLFAFFVIWVGLLLTARARKGRGEKGSGIPLMGTPSTDGARGDEEAVEAAEPAERVR